MTVGADVRHSRHRRVQDVLGRRGAELIAAYKAGATVATVAACAGVCDSTLRSFLVAEGVTLRHTPPQPKRLTVGSADLIAAYEAGATTADLAARAGVTYPTIRRFLKAQGVALRDDRGRHLKRQRTDE